MANKARGTVYEYKFFTKALDLGYDVFIPAGDNLPIDCIVQNGAGKLYKVQIKGTASENREGGRITALSVIKFLLLLVTIQKSR